MSNTYIHSQKTGICNQSRDEDKSEFSIKSQSLTIEMVR